MRDHRKYRRPEAQCDRPKCTNKVSFYGTRGLCVKHNEAYLKSLERQGKWKGGRVPSGPVVAHIDMLKSRGMGYRKIAELAGVAETTVTKSRYQKSMQRHTADKILAVVPSVRPFDGVAPHAIVTALGTRRRLRALVALGWSGADLARRLGTVETVVWRLSSGRRLTTLARTARRVDELYRELQFAPGGSVKAVNRARKHGWHPPMAWDDESIDDPAAEPVVEGCVSRRDAFLDQYFDAVQLGLDDFRAAERMGVTVEALRKRLGRAWAA